MKFTSSATGQQGSTLLEALVAILIFSFGVLALVALQAVSIRNSIDAKYRSDASYLANQIVAQMWVDRANIDSYAHYITGAVCAYTGSPSALANVTAWVTQVGSLLPGTSTTTTQIQVSTVGSAKRVKVTGCWKVPQETSLHNFSVTAQINP